MNFKEAESTGRVRLRAGLLRRAIMEEEVIYADGSLQWRKVPRRFTLLMTTQVHPQQAPQVRRDVEIK